MTNASFFSPSDVNVNFPIIDIALRVHVQVNCPSLASHTTLSVLVTLSSFQVAFLCSGNRSVWRSNIDSMCSVCLTLSFCIMSCETFANFESIAELLIETSVSLDRTLRDSIAPTFVPYNVLDVPSLSCVSSVNSPRNTHNFDLRHTSSMQTIGSESSSEKTRRPFCSNISITLLFSSSSFLLPSTNF